MDIDIVGGVDSFIVNVSVVYGTDSEVVPKGNDGSEESLQIRHIKVINKTEKVLRDGIDTGIRQDGANGSSVRLKAS